MTSSSSSSSKTKIVTNIGQHPLDADDKYTKANEKLSTAAEGFLSKIEDILGGDYDESDKDDDVVQYVYCQRMNQIAMQVKQWQAVQKASHVKITGKDEDYPTWAQENLCCH